MSTKIVYFHDSLWVGEKMRIVKSTWYSHDFSSHTTIKINVILSVEMEASLATRERMVLGTVLCFWRTQIFSYNTNNISLARHHSDTLGRVSNLCSLPLAILRNLQRGKTQNIVWNFKPVYDWSWLDLIYLTASLRKSITL